MQQKINATTQSSRDDCDGPKSENAEGNYTNNILTSILYPK